MKSKNFLILTIFILFLICSVDAITLQESKTAISSRTQVYLSNGGVTFSDVNSGVSGSTIMMIDGKRFIPATKSDGDKIIWTTGETGFLGLPDPIIKTEYSYNGVSLKELITLKEDKQISFLIMLGKDSKLIPWDHGTWKIVSATNGDTMNGIILEKPYGIDAKKYRIDMEYNFDGFSLNLTYNKTISVINKTQTEKTNKKDDFGFLIPQYDFIPITYPLIIDPTWTSAGGCWTTINGVYNVVMWNATGTTTWPVPYGVTSIEYLVIAGGGGGGNQLGGGGGAGGYRNSVSGETTGGGGAAESALTVTPGAALTITVGSGGAGGRTTSVRNGSPGADSVFGSITALGGAGGADVFLNGFNGGSGSGGAGHNSATTVGGSASAPTQGYKGGGNAGFFGSGYPAGGGGGAGTVGYNATSVNAAGHGGSGLSSSIDGLATLRGGGGGGGAADTLSASGRGGSGGGGAGSNSTANGTAGTPNTGGGGGGGSNTAPYGGGNGGSGVVIVRYLGVADFDIILTDRSSNAPTSWRWNATNLTGDNIERTYGTGSTLIMSTSNGFYRGNYLVKLNATGAGSSVYTNKTIALNLTMPRVYFWNRTA